MFLKKGLLGTLKSVNYLCNKQDRYFVISVKKSAHSVLFDYLEKDLEVWQYASLANDRYMAISWIVQGTKKRTVRWLTNLILNTSEDVTFYNKVFY